jgi:positive regulator of sigma E activity
MKIDKSIVPISFNRRFFLTTALACCIGVGIGISTLAKSELDLDDALILFASFIIYGVPPLIITIGALLGCCIIVSLIKYKTIPLNGLSLPMMLFVFYIGFIFMRLFWS